MSEQHRCPWCGKDKIECEDTQYGYFYGCIRINCGARGPVRPTEAEALAAFCNPPAAQAPGPVPEGFVRRRISVAVSEEGLCKAVCLLDQAGALAWDQSMDDWTGDGEKHRVWIEADLPLPKAAVAKGRVVG